MNASILFEPKPPLLLVLPEPECIASIVIPAKNEAPSIPATLDALQSQRDPNGMRLAPESYEVVLLLNNCCDSSAEVAHAWKALHPKMRLHIVERRFSAEHAHVGTARQLLMDTAWHRLHRSKKPLCGILTTDADTVVAPDWVSRNLTALARGADAVGGVIRLSESDVEQLPEGVRNAHRRDRHYQRLVAELEDRLDPQLGDPWPRHLDHFGASLSCTPQAYAHAGGMPALRSLEDVAFVDALRRSDARLRHDPAVQVFTSSRLEGRATAGLSRQLQLWQQMSDEASEHRVASAAWLAHRFRVLRTLRDLYFRWQAEKIAMYSPQWRMRLAKARTQSASVAEFLLRCDCDRLVLETFRGNREGSILQVNRSLATILGNLRREQPASVAAQHLCFAAAVD